VSGGNSDTDNTAVTQSPAYDIGRLWLPLKQNTSTFTTSCKSKGNRNAGIDDIYILND